MVKKSTIWDADDYNKSNGSQYRDARETIAQIIKDGANKHDMLVVDIGCGSGNVTKILCNSLQSPKKVYASDFDAQMVKYAKENCSDEKIEYFVQDISLPWEKLDERLKNLEGKVDLVWSNRVIHWVADKDKETTVKTIARLLKPGGKCYVNTTIQRDLNEFASEEERKEQEKFFNFVKHEKQMDIWRQHFGNAKLSHVNFELIEKKWTFDTEELRDQMFTSIGGYLQLYANNSTLDQLTPEKKKALWDKMWQMTVDAQNTPYGKNPKTSPRDEMADHYEQFRIIGTK
jgi:ubiquinone/menaquinone biosynthesis C-methylase UbiE